MKVDRQAKRGWVGGAVTASRRTSSKNLWWTAWTLPTAAFVAIAAAPASADTYVADNHFWELACNESGYALTSVYPMARFREAGAASKVTGKRETLYLGRMCDASHELFGDGSWCWANGGFQAEFREHRIGFPRQELHCPGAAGAIADCGC